MQQMVFAVGESDELALVRGTRVYLYRWGESRPVWERALTGTPQAVAFTRRAVYWSATDKLHQLPRAPQEPMQSYVFPHARAGAPVGLLSYETTVVGWTAKGALCKATLPEAQWRILSLGRAALTAVARCDRWLVAADTAGNAHLVSLDSWKVERSWECGLGGVAEWCYHPERRWLAAACIDGLVKVWELPSGRLVSAFASHRYGAARVAWRLPTAELVSWGEDGQLWFYDVAANRALSERLLETPRELHEALALRWRSETLVEVWTASAFWNCRLPAGRWQTIPLR